MKIAVASGKGGTGKTLVATNLFNVIQKSGQTINLVDCDAEEPNDQQFIRGNLDCEEMVTQKVPTIDTKACLFCGKCQEYCQYNAIILLPELKHIQVIEDLCHDCGACHFACKSNAISEREKPIGTITRYELESDCALIESQIEIGIYSPVPLINKAIKSTPDDQLTILDSPPGTSCPFIATVSNADFVVLVTEPTPFGLNDLQLAADTLIELKKPFGVVINRAGLGDTKVYRYLEENDIPLLAEIPFDRRIAEYYSKGQLISNAMFDYSKQFNQLYATIKKQVEYA